MIIAWRTEDTTIAFEPTGKKCQDNIAIRAGVDKWCALLRNQCPKGVRSSAFCNRLCGIGNHQALILTGGRDLVFALNQMVERHCECGTAGAFGGDSHFGMISWCHKEKPYLTRSITRLFIGPQKFDRDRIMITVNQPGHITARTNPDGDVSGFTTRSKLSVHRQLFFVRTGMKRPGKCKGHQSHPHQKFKYPHTNSILHRTYQL